MRKLPTLCLILTTFCLADSSQAQQPACSFENVTTQFEFIDQVECVDFDGDLDLDLVVLNLLVVGGMALDADFVFLENDGSGNFTNIGELLTDFSVHFELADMDGDGDIDIVNNVFSGSPDRIAVYINNGGLSFSAPTYYNLSEPFSDMHTLGDIDGDGDVDVCVGAINSIFATSPQQMELFLNDGTGVLTAGDVLPLPGRPSRPRLVDLDLDLDLEIVVNTFDGSDELLYVYTNNGDGTFSEPVPFPSGAFLSGIDVGDIDNDSNVDLALASGGAVSVLFGNGDGTFQPPVIVTKGTLFRGSVGILDVDGDSDQDLVTIRGTTNVVTLFLNNGDRTFSQDLDVNFAFSPNWVATGDFDGDGQPDASVGHSAGNLENIFFTCSLVLFGDVNMDGAVDLLDVVPFVELLSNGEFQIEADIDRDNEVNLLDVTPFVNLLQGS